LKLWIKEAVKLSAFILHLIYSKITARENRLSNNACLRLIHNRLGRALKLKVRGTDVEVFYITGGTEPHIVQMVSGKLRCDCMDFKRHAKNQTANILCVKLACGDSNLKLAVKELNENKDEQPMTCSIYGCRTKSLLRNKEFCMTDKTRTLSTRAGTIKFPAYIPVTTFGNKYQLDNLIRPYLPAPFASNDGQLSLCPANNGKNLDCRFL
jgi:hypothetical protein